MWSVQPAAGEEGKETQLNNADKKQVIFQQIQSQFFPNVVLPKDEVVSQSPTTPVQSPKEKEEREGETCGYCAH